MTLGRDATILIRCDATVELGLGHLTRCLALARELNSRPRCSTVVVIGRNTLGGELARRAGVAIAELALGGGEGEELSRLARELHADWLVVDVRSGISRQDISLIRETVRVAIIDDPGDRRLAANVAFYPPIPQVARWSWDGFSGDLKVGWQWVLLRPEFADVTRTGVGSPTRLLVTMGGTDPFGLTSQVLRALERVCAPLDVIVLGAVAAGVPGQSCPRAAGGAVEFVGFSNDAATVMASVDLAVVSFGVTAYELAAAGIPSVYLSISVDHAESACALADAGAGLSLGLYTRVSDGAIAQAVRRLLDDELRRAMALRGRALIDGRGASRVADYLLNATESGNE